MIRFIIIGLIIGTMFSTTYAGEHHRSSGKTSDKSRVEIYDKDWNRQGYIKKDKTWDTIYDKNHQRTGYIKDGVVYDKDWNRKLNIK